jgi:hypothetical protein
VVVAKLKRFIKWCIDNNIAFTHINEAIKTFRKQEEDRKEQCER